MNGLTFSLPDLAATEGLAKRLAIQLKSGDVITLSGDLGAGKTTFARALVHALGVTEDVPSPTFTLLQLYDTKDFPLYHFDLYRLKDPEEIEEIGLEEALAEGVSLIEWPEKAAAYMPRDRLALAFGQDEASRHVVIRGYGVWQERLAGWSDHVK